VESTFDLVAVAFMRSVGGRVRVLLAIDRDGEQLFEGEPALLVEHRPGTAASELVVDGADRIDPAAFELVARLAAAELAALIEASFDETGEFDGQRLLGRPVQLRARSDCFGT
jgi:hypothetical protein